MQIKVKGMNMTSTEIAYKVVKGWDVWLNINTYRRGKITFEVLVQDWECSHHEAFVEGGWSFPSIEEAVECYNSFK